MKLYVVREGAFTLNAGKPASNLLGYHEFGKRYVPTFSKMILVGRLFKQEDLAAKPVEGPGVEFLALPGYHGPMGFAKNVLPILKLVFGSIEKDACYILRVPGMIPTLYSILLWLRGIPFAVEVASDPYDAYGSQSLDGHPLAFFFRSFFVRLTKWQCRHAIASAYVTRKALQLRYPPRSADSEFNFTSIDLKPESYVDAPRPAASFNTTSPHLVLIGNMQKTLKGHDTLLTALKRVRDRGLDARLTIIGFGEKREAFEKMARELGVAEKVVFTGKLETGAPIRAVLDTADLFILPSRQEGLPRAMLEAMARGLPAIATRIGGTPELLDDNALIEVDDVDALTDRIIAFTSDEALLENLSTRNLQIARLYNVDEITKARQRFYTYTIQKTARS